ncbi:adenylate/guanylate cyclase domain-containing protein [Reyranella sp.]|uniref:adenylate/guanylate cyclase domain-containing protein n=1 Tax=Reyranella sp. TaxID=1929291 RepID=UPI003BAAA42F
MHEQRPERRLAAILAADVAGYSRLMNRDEEGTLRRLKAHLGELIEPHIATHRGRIVKRTGDGLLVDFASAVEAVRCALAIQAGMADRNKAAAEDGRIEFRIGINVGDVIIEGEDIFGDGVNIAARLESLADPGGIFVSRAVRDSVQDKLGVVLEDLGEKPVKNIARPVRVFRVGAAAAGRRSLPAVPDKPSIAVLPFANMSGDSDQEYFSDGISEDLITDLSKVSALFVIARNSSFTYKGRAVKVQEIGRELGVRFVLEGSIRKAGNRVRITAQLVDAESGGHLWADRFDREMTDIFATQDEVVHRIVEALAVKLSRVEEQDLRRGGTRNVAAYESWLRARQLLGRGTAESIAEARALHRRALALDPNFAAPHVGLAFAAVSDYVNGWGPDPALALDDGEGWARRAIELDDRQPGGHVALGNVLVWRRRHDEALTELDQAVDLDPNYAQGHALRGMALMYGGRSREALVALAVAMRLDPHYPNILLHLVAQAHFSLGEDEPAVTHLLERIARNPNTDASRMFLAAAYGHLGRIDEARAAWAGLLEVNPAFSVVQREAVLPYRNAADFQRILDGLAKAGLREPGPSRAGPVTLS